MDVLKNESAELQTTLVILMLAALIYESFLCLNVIKYFCMPKIALFAVQFITD